MITVQIGLTIYSKVKIVSFTPETDVMSNELVINTCIVDIKTSNTITNGSVFVLKSNNVLLAQYYVTDVYKTHSGFVRVEAQSPLIYLDRDILPAEMYINKLTDDAFDQVFYNTENKLGTTIHTVDPSMGTTLTGYCPQQTARERLQWICFVIGACVQTEFSSTVQIFPFSKTTVLVPDGKTFWRPTLTYKDEITAIKLKYYSFAAGTPGATDTWVKVGNTYYIETESEETGTNAGAQSGTRDNVLSFSDITLVNANNVYNILARLESFYFNRIEITADLLNLNDYKPADRITVNSGEQLVDGYVRSANYVFGKSSKTTVVVQQYSDINFVNFTLIYSCAAIALPSKTYRFPEGYTFVSDIDYIDVSGNSNYGYPARYILMPSTNHISIVIPSTDSSYTIVCTVALEYNYIEDSLDIQAVDSASLSSGVLTIG